MFILFVYRFLTLSDKYSLSLCRLFLWQKTLGIAAVKIVHESESSYHCIAVIASFLIMFFIYPLGLNACGILLQLVF